MGGFRDTQIGSKMDQYQIKLAQDQPVIIKIVKDEIFKWNEVWPTFFGNDGNRITRRFVYNEDGSNMAAIAKFRKENDIKKLLNNDERQINNWNSKIQFAVPVIVGTEQKVKDEETGKLKRKIVWDFSAKVYKFGIKVFRKLQAINHNPTTIERAEAVNKFKMADPDDPSSEGYNCTDVFALRITKLQKGKQIDYDVQADKLVGIISAKKIENLDEAMKELNLYVKPSTEEEIEGFLNSITGNSDSKEVEAEEDSDTEKEESDEKPLKKSVKKEEDDETDEEPAKKLKKDDEEIDIDSEEIPEIEEIDG